jgi:hypothetical protein
MTYIGVDSNNKEQWGCFLATIFEIMPEGKSFPDRCTLGFEA